MRRVGTAAVLLAILLAGLFFLPRAGVAALMALIIGIGGFEWARLCGMARRAALGAPQARPGDQPGQDLGRRGGRPDRRGGLRYDSFDPSRRSAGNPDG